LLYKFLILEIAFVETAAQTKMLGFYYGYNKNMKFDSELPDDMKLLIKKLTI
jgi:hypothetical protein